MSNEILGRPIVGEIPRYTEGLPKQADPQLFIDALDTLLAIEGVEAVRWRQSTPYFNDGDPCNFDACFDGLKVTGNDDGGDSGDGFEDDYNLDEPYKSAARKFESELSGKHYTMLNDKFGDPSTVTATKEGFTVEFYNHD